MSNFFVPNGAVANGAAAPNFIQAEANVSVSATLTGLAGFVISDGSAAPSGSAVFTVVPTHIHGPTVVVNPAGNLYPSATKTHALAAMLDSTVSITAFILRDTFGEADINVSCAIVAIAAEEIGESDVDPVTVDITATATRIQHPEASVDVEADIPDVDADRDLSGVADISVTANIYADSGVDDVYTAFADIRAVLDVSTDNSKVLNGKTVTAAIVVDATGLSAVDGTRVQAAEATPSVSVTFTVDAALTSALDPDAANSGVEITATPTRETFTTADLIDATATFFLSEATVYWAANADLAVSFEGTAEAYVIQPAYAPVGGTLDVSLTQEATLTRFGTATLGSTGGALSTSTTRTTQGTTGVIPLSVEVTATGTITKLPTSVIDNTSVASASATRTLFGSPDTVATSVAVTSSGVRTVLPLSVVDNAASCTIDAAEVTRTVFPTSTLGASLTIDTLETVNAESFDPPERTFTHPFTITEFTRPAQEFEFRRVA